MIRRFICHYTTKNYNRFFLSLLTKLKKAVRENRSVADTLRDELRRSAEISAVWPDDKAFHKSWLLNPIYVKSRIDRCAMVLCALEAAMHTSKNERMILREKLTVEHILPQQGTLADYPYAQEMPGNEDETNDQIRKRLVHAIGNLTLLTGPLNASVSNGPYPAKSCKAYCNYQTQ